MVAPRVAGTVLEVPVSDNQSVKAGDLLARLDPQPFEQGLAEALASLRTEQGRLIEIKAQTVAQEKRVTATKALLLSTKDAEEQLAAALSARGAEVRARKASMQQAQLDLARAEKLADQEVVPKSRLDQARTAFEMESASLAAAREFERQAEAALRSHKSSVAQVTAQLKAEEASLERIKASLGTQEGQIARREAQVKMAELRLSYTEVKAPSEGFVTRMSAEVGNTVQAGQPLMSLVSLEDAYVLANYKETRIEHILPGQRARIKIDAYPGKKFEGRVDSIMAGAGSAFTLFPTENASGNYVKVVQRVPVKITFDDLAEARPYLKIGISVVPTILTKK
jgi:membrane fusion protein (multidrug efflux system)